MSDADIERERRDRQERLRLWDIYGDERRCAGGHLVHATYCCAWCGSTSPDDRCKKENIGGDDG